MSTPIGKLAINGGTPAVTQPLPPMYPGGMRIGTEEEASVLEVLRSKRLFRYYGPTPGESKSCAVRASLCRPHGRTLLRRAFVGHGFLDVRAGWTRRWPWG